MDRDQRMDEKNGIVCLFITFTLSVKVVIKMPKMAHCLYFS